MHTGARQSGLFEEGRVGAGLVDLTVAHASIERHWRRQFGDMRLYRPGAHLFRYGEPVVAVTHEIHITDLIHIDRREAHHAVGHRIDAAPTFLHIVFPRQKRAVEVAVAPYAATDFVERDVL